MPRIYRSMSRDGEFPLIAQTARGLGVREPGDITAIHDMVSPGTGGISVAPTWRELPAHRIPTRLMVEGKIGKARGSDEDACWMMGEGPFEANRVAERLILRVTEPWHGVVEPSESMPVQGFREDIASTQSLWRIDED